MVSGVVKFIKTENRMAVARGWGGAVAHVAMLSAGYRVSVWEEKKSFGGG